MSTLTPHNLLKLLVQGQEGTVKHNENMNKLDCLLTRLVLDRDLNTPPGAPAQGDAYIVDTGGTGDWDGLDGYVVVFIGSAWLPIVPTEGMRMYVQDEQIEVVYNSTAWVNAPGGSATKTHEYYRQVGTGSYESWYAACTSSGNYGTGLPAADLLYALPFISPRGGTLDGFAFEVSTLVSGNGRFGVYRNTSDTNLYPAALVWDSGGGGLGSGANSFFPTPIAADPGELLWFVLNTDSAANTFRCLQFNATSLNIFGLPATLGALPRVGLSVAHTYGALPDPFPGSASLLTTGSVLPVLACRYSA